MRIGQTRDSRRARLGTGTGSWCVWDAYALTLLLVTTVLFYWPLITPNLEKRHSYPAGDFYDQFHAFATYEHDRLWKGEIPLWNPTNFGGHPFLADVQSAVFYPPSLAVMLLSGPGRFSPLWLELEAIAHFYMGAAFMYLFVRRLLVGQAMDTEADPLTRAAPGLGSKARAADRITYRAGPLISALTFAFGGYLTGYPSQQLAILETQVWLPLILLLLDVGLLERKGRYVLGAGLAWGMALLAGHPQSAMYVMYGALLYGFYRSWRAGLNGWRAVTAQAAWVSIGFGLAAVQLWPAYEFMRLSVRSSLSYEALAGGFALRDVAQYLLPGILTHWSPMYVGILPLFLALLACVIGWRSAKRGEILFWVGLALVSLVLSFGGKGYLYRLFYWVVPGFRLFRSQERAIYLTGFGLAVLAGWGWQLACVEGLEGRIVRRSSWGLLVLGVGSLAGTLVAWMMRGAHPAADSWLGRLSLLALLAWSSWMLVRWVPRRTVSGALLALIVVMVDLGRVNLHRNLAPGRTESRIYDSSWLAPVLEDDGLYRIANEWGLPGNVGCWLRRQDLYGASPLRLSAHKTMADALPHWRLWQLFDVRYVTTWEHDLPGPFPWKRIAMRGQEWAKDTVYAFRLETDFPRAWVVHRARHVGDGAALEQMANAAWDPSVEVLLPSDAPEGYAPGDPPSPPAVAVVEYAAEQIAVRAELSAPGWLVLGEWDYPGWRARVDGRRQDIYRVDYGLRAVPLAAGNHLVTLSYRPPSVYVGTAVSGLVLAGVAVSMVTWDRRRTAGRDADR